MLKDTKKGAYNSTGMESAPIVVRRTIVARFAHFLYVVLWIILVSSLAAIVLMIAFDTQNTSGVLSTGIFGSLPVFAAIAFWMHLRKKEARIEIWPDRLVRRDDKKVEEFPYGELELYRFIVRERSAPLVLRVTRIALRTRDGNVVRLNPEEWPNNDIAAALDEVAVPRITESLRDRLTRHEEVSFRELPQAGQKGAQGLVLLVCWAAFFMYMTIKVWERAKGMKLGALLTFALGVVPPLLALRTLFRVDGMLLSRDGLRPAAAPRGPTIPWSDVTEVVEVSTGLRITVDGRSQPLTASPACGNYQSLVAIVLDRVPRSAARIES